MSEIYYKLIENEIETPIFQNQKFPFIEDQAGLKILPSHLDELKSSLTKEVTPELEAIFEQLAQFVLPFEDNEKELEVYNKLKLQLINYTIQQNYTFEARHYNSKNESNTYDVYGKKRKVVLNKNNPFAAIDLASKMYIIKDKQNTPKLLSFMNKTLLTEVDNQQYLLQQRMLTSATAKLDDYTADSLKRTYALDTSLVTNNKDQIIVKYL